MTTSDPNDARKSAAKNLVDGMDFNMDRVGVVSWNITATAWPLTNNSSVIKSEVDSVGANGNTSLDVGLVSAIRLLSNSHASKIIVFLTDGVSTGEGHYSPSGMPGSLVDLARTQGIVVFTIGLGQYADTKNLVDMLIRQVESFILLRMLMPWLAYIRASEAR